MSNDDLFENDQAQSSGGGLRKQLEDALAELNTYKTELSQFRAEKRKSSLEQTLKAKGVADDRLPSALDFYNSDDVSEDAVGKWVEQHASIFKPQAGSATDPNAEAASRVVNAGGNLDTNTESGDDAYGRPILGDFEEIQRALQTLPRDELERLGYVRSTKPRNLYGR